jgi:hypothetical protein
MAVIDGVGLAEPSTITKSLAAVPITRNSSVTYQEVMVLGSPNSTSLLALAEVMGSAPASTTVGLVTRIAGPVTIAQSTATDLLARVNQGVGNSSVGDRWRVNVANSSAADFVAVRLVDSSGTGFLTPGNEYTDASTFSSFAGPTLTYDNSSNNTYRAVGIAQPFPVQLRPGINNYNSQYSTIASTASSAFYTLISSVASVRPCVYAYSVTSTAVAACLVEFVSGTVTAVWHTEVGSGSSGVTGANLAVAPPGRLFQSTATALPLLVRLGSTGVEVKFSMAWFTE